MSPASACLNATSSLREIHVLKQAFDTAYETALMSKSEIDKQKALELKDSLEKMIRTQQEQMVPVEMERLFNLRKQYDFQTSVLKKVNLVESRIERDTSGKDQEILFIKDEAGAEYPLPSFVSILNKIVEKRELLSVKASQDFKHLLLVPFGMPLEIIVERLDKYLSTYKKTVRPSFQIDGAWRVSVSSKLHMLDKLGNTAIVYDQIQLRANNHGGKTKKQILEEQNKNHTWNKGWRTSLIQMETNKKGIHPISKIASGAMEIGRSPDFYFTQLIQAQNDPSLPLHGQSGVTPEEWILSFIYHLEEAGTILDDPLETDYTMSSLPSTYFLSSYLHRSDEMLYGYWARQSGRIDITEDHIMNTGTTIGLRTVVKI